MIQILLTLAILVLLTLFYYFYLRPLKRIERYAREFQAAGYKVLKFSFNPFNLPLFKPLLNDSKKGDPFKTYKQKFTPYDILVGNIFTTPSLSFISPAARKQFTKNQVDYAYIKVPFIVEISSTLIGKGLVFSEGDQWKRKRRIVSSLFTYEFLSKKVPQMVKICQQSFEEMQRQCLQKQQQKQTQTMQYEFHLIDLTSRIFSNIILSLFLGTESLEEKIDGKKLCHFTIDLITQYNIRSNQPVPLLLGQRFVKLGLTSTDRDLNRRKILFNKWASNYIQKILQKQKGQQKTENKNTDLIRLLYNSGKGKENSYQKQQLIDELKVFFFAGTDTTSHLLEIMIYYAVKNQHVYHEVRKQIDSFDGQICSVQDLKKLKYIQAIQKQTIRYYGPLPVNFPRVSVKNHLFNGVQIDKGTGVQFHSVTTHFDPKYYENPYEFRPERWLNEKKQFDAACLTGFGMGPRSCIGQQLANIEAKIAFFYFFKRYKEIQVPKQINFRWGFMNEAQNLWIKTQKFKSTE